MDFLERARKKRRNFWKRIRKVMMPSDEEIRLLIEKRVKIYLKRDGPRAEELKDFKFCLIQDFNKRGGRLFFKVLMKGRREEKIMEVSERDLDLFGARIKIYQEGLFKEE